MRRFPDVDPAAQAEAHQLALDRLEEHLPRCDCCREVIVSGIYYELEIRDEYITVCFDCAEAGKTVVMED